MPLAKLLAVAGSRQLRSQGPAVSDHGPRCGAAFPQAPAQPNAYAMVQRRAAVAGIAVKIGNHTFRATGITAYLRNGGTL